MRLILKCNLIAPDPGCKANGLHHFGIA
jgi:hypothetical protein